MIEAQGLGFSYGSVQVLFDVDFRVAPGEVVAVLGTNGAGKSTLLTLLAGLAVPSAGAVLLDGEDVSRIGAAERLRRGVVLVQGGRAVFPDLTVIENLEVGLHSKQLNRAEERRRAGDALEHFPALRGLRARRAATLSGGEQQQLAVAKGLLADPRVLMIDELSLGLAPQTREEMVDTVRALNAAGTTVVLVEQSLDVAASLTDRVVFMEKGTVRFDGPAADLLERGDLARAVFLGAGER